MLKTRLSDIIENNNNREIREPKLAKSLRTNIRKISLAVAFVVAGLIGCTDKKGFDEMSTPDFGNYPGIVERMNESCIKEEVPDGGTEYVSLKDWLEKNPTEVIPAGSIVTCPKK